MSALHAWVERQDNQSFFLLAVVAYTLLSIVVRAVMFGGPLIQYLPEMVGGSLALAYVTMLGRPRRT
jgi:hypothetical protein